jgi:succinyl-diaminopimelate desuccinylase
MSYEGIKWELDFLRRLVAIDTTNTGSERRNYDKCANLIVAEAEKLDLQCRVIDGRRVTADGESRPNVVIDLTRGSGPTIVFVTHYDVVPVDLEKWNTDPFDLTMTGGKAFGRGAADDKSAIAVVLGAMRQLEKEDSDVNFRLCAACDEESGGPCGIEYLFKEAGIQADAGVVVDAGPERIGIGASGSVWGKVTVKGKGGHSGNPDVLDNPIYRTARLIKALQSYHRIVKATATSKIRSPPEGVKPRLYGRFAITMISAGRKENIVPSDCEFRFDRRLTPEEDPEKAAQQAKSFIQSIAEKQGANVRVQILSKVSGYYTEPKHPWVRHFSHIVRKALRQHLQIGADLGFDDGRFLADAGIPVVTFGPLRYGTRYHGDNEFVWLKDIRNLRSVFVELGRTPGRSLTRLLEP